MELNIAFFCRKINLKNNKMRICSYINLRITIAKGFTGRFNSNIYIWMEGS